MTTRPTTPRRRRFEAGADDGITIVLVALLAVVLLLVAALAIDGGTAYANRRQMQNAADAAAMAGTRAVDELRFGGETDGGTIWDAVDDSRSANSADTMTCRLLRVDGTPHQPATDVCADRATMASRWNSLSAAGQVVAGVEAEMAGVKETFFSQVGGVDETSARASAAATIQPYVGGGAAPFIICGYLPRDIEAYDMLRPDGTFKPSAFTRYGPGGTDSPFTLQGGGQAQNQGVPGCGLGSSFDGKLDQAVTSVVIGTPGEGGARKRIQRADPGRSRRLAADALPADRPLQRLRHAHPDRQQQQRWQREQHDDHSRRLGRVQGLRRRDRQRQVHVTELLAEGSVVDGGIGGTGDVGAGQARLIKLVR